METIRVPKPTPEAFHKNRRVSDLLMSQIAHFQHVAQKQGLKIDPEVARDVHTEGGAARFIATVTRLLHKAAASPAKGKVLPIRRAEEAGEGAPIRGTVHRIAAVAGGSTTASKPKTQAKTAKKSAKNAAAARNGAKAKTKQREKS